MQVLPNTAGTGLLPLTQAQDTGASSNTGFSSASTATVTANDFLQLLVAEMKNQDPTANTDPMQYINQLVQVNSLEQLVQINQDLGGGSSTSSSGSSGIAKGSRGVVDQPAPVGSAGNLSAGDSASTAGAALRVGSALAPRTSPANPVAENAAGASSGNRFDTIVAAMHRSAAAASNTNNSPAR